MFSIQSPKPHPADSLPTKHTVRLPHHAHSCCLCRNLWQNHNFWHRSMPSRYSLVGVTVQGTALALGAIRKTSESNYLFDRCYQISKFNAKRKLEPSLFPRARVFAQTDASRNEDKTCPTLIPLTYKSPPPVAYVYPTYRAMRTHCFVTRSRN